MSTNSKRVKNLSRHLVDILSPLVGEVSAELFLYKKSAPVYAGGDEEAIFFIQSAPTCGGSGGEADVGGFPHL